MRTLGTGMSISINWFLNVMKAGVSACGLILVLSILFGFRQPQNAATFQEYQVKAAFLFNFAHFVEWPEGSLPEKESRFVIGILGEDPFGQFLKETINGEKINGHELIAIQYAQPEQIKECHILFVNMENGKPRDRVIESLKGKNILTVSDGSGFVQNGGMIQFTKENSKIHLKVNLEATKENGLTISSKLLRLAEIVNSSSN